MWEADGGRARTVGSGRKRTSELGVVVHLLAFFCATPHLTGPDRPGIVACFLEFRFFEIAVNRTRVSNGLTPASTAGFHFSNSHLGKLSSHTVLASLRRKGYTGDSLRPWEAPGSAPYRHFTPPKLQKMLLERTSQGKWGKAEPAW